MSLTRDEALVKAAKALVDSAGLRGEAELQAAIAGAGSLHSNPLSDATLRELSKVLGVPRTPSLQATAGALLEWKPREGAEFWVFALIDKAKLFRAAPGEKVELASDSVRAFLQWADFEAFDLALAHGLDPDLMLNDYSLLQHALERRWRDLDEHRAGWKRLALTLAARPNVDRRRKLIYRLEGSPRFKKGLTPAGMVKEAARQGHEHDAELLFALEE